MNTSEIDNKVILTARLPKKIHDKLLDIAEFQGYNTKTEALVFALNSFFTEFGNMEKIQMKLIENTFNIGNKVLMPISLYQSLTCTSDEEMAYLIESKRILAKVIDITEFVILDPEKSKEIILIEYLLQKQQITNLRKEMAEMKKLIKNK